MKYERKSPFSDGFNDTYAGFGVDADDYWARKRMLLGSGGGGDGGDEGGYLGFDPAVDNPTDMEMTEAAVGVGAPGTGQSITGIPDQNLALDTSLVQDVINFVTPFDLRSFVTPTLMEETNISLNPVGALSTVFGVPFAGLGYNAVGGPNISIGTTTSVPGATFGTAPSVSLDGIGGLTASPVSLEGIADSVSNTFSGPSTGGPSSTGGFGDQGGGDPALDVTNPYGILSLGTTIQEQDLNVGGNAQTAGTAFPIVPINTTDVGTSGFNLAPTTRPLVNPPIRQPVTLQTPFFRQPNFQPFARPMRNGGAVHHGIGSMLQIR